MRVEPSISLKNKLYKRYWRTTRQLFAAIRQPIIDRSEHTDPANLKALLPVLLQPEPMQKHIDAMWSKIGGKYYYDTASKLKSGKESIPEMEYKIDKEKLTAAEQRMYLYSNARSLQKTKSIMTTYEESINRVIDSVIQESLDEGLGIIESRRLLTHDLKGEEMLQMENWQAQRISMTEIGSAQNTGSFEAAQDNKEGVLKHWIFIPGMKTFREEHQGFDVMGDVEMDYEYAPGLQYAGDPDCNDAEEVINCFCSIGYSVDN